MKGISRSSLDGRNTYKWGKWTCGCARGDDGSVEAGLRNDVDLDGGVSVQKTQN